jgi:hypothetical protein
VDGLKCDLLRHLQRPPAATSRNIRVNSEARPYTSAALSASGRRCITGIAPSGTATGSPSAKYASRGSCRPRRGRAAAARRRSVTALPRTAPTRWAHVRAAATRRPLAGRPRLHCVSNARPLAACGTARRGTLVNQFPTGIAPGVLRRGAGYEQARHAVRSGELRTLFPSQVETGD